MTATSIRSETRSVVDMADSQNSVGDGRPSLEETKQMRREYPSGWMELATSPGRSLLVDAILDSPPGHRFTTGTISERAGITPQSVRDHVDILIDRGIVEKIGDTEYRIVEDSLVLEALEELNSAVTAVRSGAAEQQTGKTDPDIRMDNAEKRSNGKTAVPMQNRREVTNAD